MGELGFPELSTEQIKFLCQATEDAARQHILSKVAGKEIERLDIVVEVEGAKPVSVSVEVDLLLEKDTKGFDAETLVKEAIEAAHLSTENFLRKLK